MTSKTSGTVREIRSNKTEWEIVVLLGEQVLALAVDYEEARRFRVGDEVAIGLRRAPRKAAQ